MNEHLIAAGIVIYNPGNTDRMLAAIKAISKQIKQIYIYDNSTKKTKLQLPHHITYLTENSNKGIAYALNRIMEQAQNDGYPWVLTMDQDSILPDGIVNAYCQIIGKYKKLGIVCPQIIDSRRSYMEVKKEPLEESIEFCITSASCTSVEAWNYIGKFDEWLFIDLVDNDFCKRLIISGYKIIRLNQYILDQEFGKIIPKSKKTQIFWIRVSRVLNNRNFAKLSYKKFVCPSRVYHTCKNIIYVNRKLSYWGKVAFKENYNCNGYIGFIISFCFPSILRAQNKKEILKNMIKGFRDGLRCHPPKWNINEQND